MNQHAAAEADTLPTLIAALRAEEAQIRLGGGAEGHRAAAREGPAHRPRAHRQARSTPARRFFELGLWAGVGHVRRVGRAPSAGVVTGIGTVARPAAS